MCDVLDRVEEKGRQEEKRRTAASLHSMGMTMVTICIRMENIQQIFPE